MVRHAPMALSLLVCLAAACRPAATPTRTGTQWHECRLPKLAEVARCTTVTVPADRDKRGGSTMDLHVAMLPAVRPQSKPDPLVFLAGGPGQAASAVVSTMLPSLHRIRRDRDLVFIDVRGTGRSGRLDCELFDDQEEGMRRLLDHRVPEQLLARCRQGWKADLSLYRTRFLVDDLEQVADELGWHQVNVYGVSYGTRAALAWLARHPKRLRTVVLDGSAPYAMRLFEPFARDAESAWQGLVTDCAADSHCKAAFPDLDGDLRRLLARFDAGPKHIVTEHPRTGAPLRVTVTRGGIALAVRGMMYSADLQALLPMTIRDALAHDYRPLAAQTLAIAEGADESSSLGMLLSVVCSEDVDRIDATALPVSVSGTFVGATMLEQARTMCRGWPRFTPQPVLYKPVHSDLPALLISGSIDPVTPARWADVAASTLSRSRHLIATGAGHGAGREACTSRIIAAFVAGASVDGLESQCLETMKRPPFFVRRVGSAP